MVKKRDLFHSFSVGGATFVAYAGDQPWIFRQENEPLSGGVALGDILVIDILAEPKGLDPAGCYICKYSDREPRISLAGLNIEEIEALAEEFQIPLGYSMPKPQKIRPSFFESKAGQKLLEWSLDHPRLSKKHASKSHYLKEWLGHLK